MLSYFNRGILKFSFATFSLYMKGKMQAANFFGPSVLVLRHFWQLQQQTTNEAIVTNKIDFSIMFGIRPAQARVTIRMSEEQFEERFGVECENHRIAYLESAIKRRKILANTTKMSGKCKRIN